ncbi:MAG: biotin--[acetyl-CoA-carboxylase] ligase [Actinomycetota bacterium]|nr:biotin--[acetyl-CoA-carboxylase] ligase [Actinomycetota bacterium]
MNSKETDNTKATEKDSVGLRGAYLAKTLKNKGFGPISWVEQTGSTNTDLLEKTGSGNIDRAIMITDFQTSGKGRRDRKWVAEPNSSLLMSVGFLADTKKINLGVFASGLAVATCTALHSLGFEQARIKWPNDIVVSTPPDGEQAKLAGVLAQSKLVRNSASVVVGIGINVHPSSLRDSVPERRVVSLSDLGEPPDRVHLAETILSSLGDIDFRNSSFWDTYRSLSETIGQHVRVTTERIALEGIAKDITKSGSLLLKDNEGTICEVTSGDLVSLRLL